jgi:hypothetical protein
MWMQIPILNPLPIQVPLLQQDKSTTNPLFHKRQSDI